MNAPLRDPLSDLRLIGMSLTPAEGALAESLPAVLHPSTYEALFQLGIHGAALTGADTFDALHVEAVCFLPGERFEFARDMYDPIESVLAIIIPCRNEFGQTADLAAWEMESGRLARWRGTASMLGEDELGAPRIEFDGVYVCRDPLEWLRKKRRGVVLIDAERARWRLAAERLVVGSADFGRRLCRKLRLPEPKIFVDCRSEVAA